ncbi:MAG: sodium/solute symporter [Candidatus Latescibacteria bacterium]|nr:sodium/solute symporter [Candidatus Latescibacterota bacterium]NIO00989.1 sodium/solute symporter [Candidatus Latescibacterota bacterium]NIO27388.1 sodium/solute symporter [Candidatus Latescibacterota bacterium]NIO54910.1 sodium/solute symporter [Candidatus Latescibacterota bacterium]NIT00999.1 sodium/solute symporter [Candidatus Latescibacterota bacterium]
MDPATSFTFSADWSLLLGIVVYLIIILVCGITAANLMKRLDDFLLAGRRLGALSAAISERASGESAWFLLGLPGAAYALGFTEFWSVIGIAFGIFASWTLLALPLRRETEKLGALTLPDYFEMRFRDSSRSLRIISMLIIIFFYTTYVAAQFVASGKILNATFGLDPVYGVLIGTFVVMVYTMLGGFVAVVWTDVLQGLMMATVAVVLPIVGLIKLGGPHVLADKVAPLGEGFLRMDGGETGSAFIFGIMLGSLSWGFGYLGQPHLLSRYMAIRQPRDIKQGMLIAMIWVLIAYWGAPLVGIVGAGTFDQPLADQEMVMPLLARQIMPGWIAGLMIAGAVAAMMSTADSQLIVVTSSLVEDVYVKLLRPKADPKRLVLLSRMATIAASLVALALALASKDLIFNMVSYAWAGLGSSFGPPLLLSLRWKKTTAYGVLAGMLSGTISNVIWKNTPTLNAALDLKLASFVISFVFTVLVSLATHQRHSRKPAQ